MIRHEVHYFTLSIRVAEAYNLKPQLSKDRDVLNSIAEGVKNERKCTTADNHNLEHRPSPYHGRIQSQAHDDY